MHHFNHNNQQQLHHQQPQYSSNGNLVQPSQQQQVNLVNVVGRKAGLINEQSAAQFQQQFLYGSGNSTPNSTSNLTGTKNVVYPLVGSISNLVDNYGNLVMTGAGSAAVGAGSAHVKNSTTDLSVKGLASSFLNGNGSNGLYENNSPNTPSSVSSSSIGKDTDVINHTGSLQNSTSAPNAQHIINNNNNSNPNKQKNRLTATTYIHQPPLVYTNPVNGHNHPNHQQFIGQYQVPSQAPPPSQQAQSHQILNNSPNRPQYNHNHNHQQAAHQQPHLQRKLSPFDSEQLFFGKPTSAVPNGRQSAATNNSSRAQYTPPQPPPQQLHQQQQQPLIGAPNGNHVATVAKKSNSLKTSPRGPVLQQQQQQQQNHSILNPTTNVSSQHAEALNPFNGNGVESVPNQRHSKHHHHHHNHHQHHPQRSKAPPPPLSISTNNSQSTQNLRQPSSTPTANTVSPIQLQNLAHSPSVSDFRVRSRSTTATPNPTTSSGQKQHHQTQRSSSKQQITPPPIHTSTAVSNLKSTLQNIELKMRIIASPNIRIADLFKCFLKNVPKSTETIESLVHYGDNIGAKIVKCLINENLYESQSLINQDYDIYQGPALCVTYDAILRDEHWDEIFICNDEEFPLPNGSNGANGTSANGGSGKPATNGSASSKTGASSSKSSTSKNSPGKEGSPSSSASVGTAQQASKFISFFHISDFIAILSGYKVAFVDPYERFAPDERSYVAIFDLEHDTQDIEQFEDQFKPLEKIFNVPLLKTKYYNGTIIRLPLRTQSSTCSVSSKLVHVKDILVNAKDFMKEAHLHILFAKNISNIQFCRTKDNQNIEKIYSINVEDSCVEQFRTKYKKISDAIADGEFPRTSTIMLTLRKQIETKIEKTEWILSIFADTMRLLNSNYFLMKLAIPISDNCDKDIRFSHKSNLISSDTGFIKTLYLAKPIICYIEDKEGILMSHFCRLNISDSLKLSHFNDAYALMLKDLTKLVRKDPSLLWSLMPDIEKNAEFADLLAEIWQEIGKHELFYSCTEGWGYVAIEDMIINDVEDKSVLQEILTKVYSETNYPVVIMPAHVLKALQKYAAKDTLQIMTPSQTSDILHNNVALIEQLKPNQKIELLRYLIKEPASQSTTANGPTTNGPAHLATSSSSSSLAPWPISAARYVLDLPLLLLANQKFVRFQTPNKSKSIFYVEREYMPLFNNPESPLQLSQFINPDLPKDILNVFKKFEFQRLTQIQMISDSELSELLSVPREWRAGDEKISWPRAHEKYNAEWLEMLWKYLTEYSRDDLAMMENLNIVYGVTKPSKTPRRESITNATQPDVKASSNMVLYKLTTNSNLIYTPSYDSLSDNNGSTNGANNNTTNEPVTTTTTTTNGVDSNGTNTNNISEETYLTLIKILNKLGFQCLDSISPSILAHPAFNRYVPNLRSSTSPRYDLLRAFRNKYKHASSAKITQDFNALLNEADIKLLQRYLAKIELGSTKSADEERELVDFLKQLPIFENGASECVDKYIALKDAGLIYDAHVRLPFELPNSKPFLIVDESECKLLIAEKLHLNFVRDFSVIIKEIVKYCGSKELNTLPPHKIHALGKWILLNCATYILASLHPNNNSNGHNHTNQKQANSHSHHSNDLIDCLKNAKLFMNQKQELCAASQFINPLAKDRYVGIFDLKCLPAKDLLSDEKCMNMLKELKMRNCLQLKVDEIIDLYEHSLKQSDSYRRLLAELIIDILVTRIHEAASPEAIEKSLNEYSSLKAVTLRHFLMSVAWIPLQRDRPQSYPQTLRWKGCDSSSSASTAQNATASAPIVPNRFSSPRECVDSHFAYCAGSVSFVSNLDVPNELKPYIELKQVKLEQVVMHLKNMTKDFSNLHKVECYDYLTVSKRCYEFMSAFEKIEILNELNANNLTEWIWNGSGFSSINSIYILTEKDHPLSTHVESLPYELYVFVKFFERLGIKKLPDTKQLEQILVRCVKNTQKLILAASTASPTKLPSVNGEHSAGSVLENAAKNFPFINWIKTYYGAEKKLASIIKDYEESLAAVGASSPFVASSASSSTQSSPSSAKLNGTSSPTDSPTKQEHPPAFDFNSADSIYLYLPEIYKSVEIKDNLINSVATLVKNRQIKILDEEAYLMRKVTSSPPTSNGNSKSSSHNNNIYDHYRVYNEIILPNLNSLSKNVKDACVLFALDHADPKMLDILRDHPCIPVTPLGRKLRKPNKLVHPSSRLAALYSDVDERFPCGSEDTYVRDDRLQVLKILGMKSDGLTWSELVERADSIAKIREFDVALDRAVALLAVLNDMLSSSPPTAANQDNRSKHMNGSQDEKEWRQRACELIRDIAFIPVKPRTYTKLNLPWYGDKYKHKFAKPKELLALGYEPLCSTLFALPLGEYKKKELVVSKQVEQFLGLDDLAAKFTLRDALKQLDEVAKTNLAELDDAKEVKLVAEMCFHLYEYIQAECQRKPENIGVVREFFGQDRKCILLNEEFVSVGQLCGQLNVNLKPMFYQVPTVYLRSFKFLFNQVLSVRAILDLNDLLHVIDALKRKYRDQAVSSREDFGTLIAVYGLMIDQGHQVITNLYLPNVKSVLLPGRLLYMNPLDHATLPTDRPEDFVHPAVDRRICLVAGCPVKKSPGATDDKLPVAPNSVRSATSATEISSNIAPVRIFPRVFGNKRLEGILARLDDDKINANLVANMDEGNPLIVLDYLVEANLYHSLSAYLTDDDVFVILKYFNDFLARNHPGPFNRLRDLKIFKPVWSDKYINLASVPNNTTQTLVNLTAMNTNQLQTSACLISDEMATLMRRSFKQNPFQVVQVASANGPAVNPLASASNSSMGGSGSGLIILVRRLELAKLYTHLNLLCFNDLEAFLTLCLPHFRKLDAKAQNNFLKYLYEEILEKSYMHERERCFKILREKLFLQTRRGDHQLISDLYDMKSETLKHILTDAHFPDENFDSPQCLKFLKEAGLRTYLPSELCKKCMNEIEQRVANESWSDELRSRSKWLYEHLVENWQRFDDSVLQQRFLEPYCPRASLVTLRAPFEYAEFKRTCLKLSDAELHKYELLVWSSSYLLPAFVTQEALDTNTAEFLKLNRQPCFALVNQHLSNIVESVAKQAQLVSSSGDDETTTSASDGTLLEVLSRIYQYLDELSQSEHNKDICKQLEEKEIVWSSSTRKFVAPNKLCIQLDPADEIPPFLFSLSPALKSFKSLFLRLGAKDKPFPMLYGDILRKLAKVCGDDYLNSNELCKALKAMECFFKYLKTSAAPPKNGEDASKDPSNSEYISSQYKLPGLYFVTTELKLEKSSSVVILDNKENIDDISKLPHEKFVFNPTEKVFKISTSEIKPLIDKIFISQRPTLFSQKYEATYDFSLPDDPDSQRQNLLTSLERKYQQIFTSRQLHRCLARCIADEEARRPSPKHLPIDEVEKVIRERLSSIKVTCVEYLETSLAYRKLSNQQKLEQTVEEKACYLTHESSQFATLYVSKKHIEQPYFALCLARALQPLLLDLHFDYSIFTSLIATSVSQMSKLLQLANVASEENILSVIKLQYVPSSGKLYGDDVNLLAQYDTKLHNVLIGDLCVFVNSSGAYIYCQVLKIFAKKVDGKNASKSSYSTASSSNEEVTYEFLVQVDDNQTVRIGQKELYVLENWHRIYDAVIAKPPDERESFRYSGEGQYASSGAGRSDESSSSRQQNHRTPGDGEENFSSGQGSDSDRSDTSSTYGGSQENIPSSIELEQARNEVNNELRLLFGLDENERKKKINRLLLKWHPDKNQGKEKFASEIFKHLKKQIEAYKNDPFLSNYYRSAYSSYSGFTSATGGSGTGGFGGTSSSRGDDYRSRHYGSFEDLHRSNRAGGAGSPGSGSPHSSPSREGSGGAGASSYDYDSAKGPGPSNLGRAGSFRQEWERRRQQKRQNASGSDPRDRSSPSSARRRGTDFTQMDATLWFTQAKCDMDSANNDMHPITGKPAYEWVCYKCYRAVEKALRAYHYFKGNGKLPASDIHGLLLGVEPSIRDIAFRFCNFISNESSSMQYPGIARFGKTPNEVFPLSKAEQAMDYAKELLKLVEEVIYAN